MRSRRVILVSLLIAATILLFLISLGKWSDPIIDSGREWIVPDALAGGAVLYRDVVYWFGPFTPYFHAAFFRLFDSSFRTLVLAGVVGSMGVLVALYFALRRLTAKLEAVLGAMLAVPVLVFMPNSGGSILGMGFRMWHAAAFSLVAIALAGRPLPRKPVQSAVIVGALCALAGLCRTEWGLVALMASVLACGARRRFRRESRREAGVMVGAAVLIFGGVLSLFIAISGPAALVSDAPVLLVGIPDATRRSVLLSGLRDWRGGLGPLLYSTAMWIGAFLLVELAALRGVDPQRTHRRVPLLVLVAVILLLTASSGGTSGASLLSAAPVICASGVVVGLRGGSRPQAALLAGYGLAGLLLSHRRLFYISDAPYVAPPLLFAFCTAACLLRRIVVSETDRLRRHRLRAGVLGAIAALVVLAFAGRILRYKTEERVPIPGTAGMLSARPGLSHEIAELASAVRRRTHEGDGLVVFPEGEVLNYLSGRRNPIRYKLYLPGYLSERNEDEILRALERARPAAVVIWNRPTGEYGQALFGESYGRAIRRWIEDNYAPQPYKTTGRPNAILAIRKEAN